MLKHISIKTPSFFFWTFVRAKIFTINNIHIILGSTSNCLPLNPVKIISLVSFFMCTIRQ